MTIPFNGDIKQLPTSGLLVLIGIWPSREANNEFQPLLAFSIIPLSLSGVDT